MKTLRFVKRCCLIEVLVLLALFATPAPADQDGDFIFDRNGATAVLTGYVGPGDAVVIPDRLGNLPVASIGNSAFHDRKDLTSVTIPDSVTFHRGLGVLSLRRSDECHDPQQRDQHRRRVILWLHASKRIRSGFRQFGL